MRRESQPGARVLDHLVIAVVDQGPPGQQFVGPGQQLLVLGLVRERVGRRLTRLGAVTIAQVELQACEQGRKPAAIHQQVPVLSEGDLAPKELGEVVQTQLHAPDQHRRWGGRVVAAEPVHGPIDHLERPAAEVGCLRLAGQLQNVDQIPLLDDDEVLRTSQVRRVWEHLRRRKRVDQGTLSRALEYVPFGQHECEHRAQHPGCR